MDLSGSNISSVSCTAIGGILIYFGYHIFKRDDSDLVGGFAEIWSIEEMHLSVSDISPVSLTAIAGILIYFGYNIIRSLKLQYDFRMSLNKHWEKPPCHWFWGHAGMVTQGNKYPEKLIEYFKSQSKKYPYGSLVYLGPFSVILRVCHPDLFQAILGGSEKKCPKSRQIYDSLLPWLGKGLLLLEGKEWHRHRRLLTNSFHSEILRPYCKKMNDCCNVFLKNCKEKCKDGKPLSMDVFEGFSLLTIDVLMQSLMGFQTNCQNDSSVHNLYVSKIYALSQGITNRYRGKKWLHRWNIFYMWSAEAKAFKQNCKDVRKYAEKVIEKRRKEYADGVTVGGDLGYNKKNQRHYDFLDILLQSKDTDGNHLSDKEISDEVNTFMFAGHDTTTSSMSWVCYCLAMNPEYQEKCYKEIVDVMRDKHSLEVDEFPKLEYLTLCIKESMRMHPPVASIMRKPTVDIEVDGRVIKAGTNVNVSIFGLHYNPLVWEDPDTFDPSRFTKENSKNRHPYAYIPFSAGIRNCIGQNFAMNELKVCLSHVLRNFKLSIDESKKIVPCIELIYRARGGMHMLLTPREMT